MGRFKDWLRKQFTAFDDQIENHGRPARKAAPEPEPPSSGRHALNEPVRYRPRRPSPVPRGHRHDDDQTEFMQAVGGSPFTDTASAPEEYRPHHHGGHVQEPTVTHHHDMPSHPHVTSHDTPTHYSGE